MIQELRVRIDKPRSPIWFCLVLKLFILVLTLIFIAGCTTPVYIDSGSNTSQARTIKAVLSDCVAQEVGKVGETNLSLSKAYIRSTEGMLVCQEISLGIIDQLNSKES